MLVAKLGTDRIDAAVALRGPAHLCPNPNCKSLMNLKKGRINIAHFAHRRATHPQHPLRDDTISGYQLL